LNKGYFKGQSISCSTKYASICQENVYNRRIADIDWNYLPIDDVRSKTSFLPDISIWSCN